MLRPADGKVLWEKASKAGPTAWRCADGRFIYVPSLESDHWHVIDAITGDVIKKLVPKSGAH